MVQVSDRYAPEHLQILAADHDWWLAELRNYGSLFLGEGSTVTHGDKCSGTNHILPTRGGSRFTGGLNVQKFVKILTWQKIDQAANRSMSAVGSQAKMMFCIEPSMVGTTKVCKFLMFNHDSSPVKFN